MKKFWKILIVFLALLITPILFFSIMRVVKCNPDESVYPVSLPLAKAVVTHIEKYGVPENLGQIENSPYILIPCSQKTKNFECEQYFFIYKNKPFSASLLKLPAGDGDMWIRLRVAHDFTVNYYPLSLNNEIEADALHPRIHRRPIGICHQFKQ